MNNSEISNEKIKKLFLFLKEFNRIKIKPQLNVDSFEKVLWFYKIPKEKECYSIIQNKNFDKVNFDKWLVFKKPKRERFPKPPSEIKAWLKESTLKKATVKPELYKYILDDSLDINKNEKRIFLKDYPKIQKVFEKYLKEEWTPWSKEEQRLSPVLKLYDNLYRIYNKFKNQAENYQLVLGLGFLCSKDQKDKPIKRHLIEAPASIEFQAETGTITVKPFEENTELSLTTDMIPEMEKPKNSSEIKSKLLNLSNDFWKKKKEFHGCLKSWLHSYDSKGQFYELNEPPSHTFDSFSDLTVSPALILKKRNEKEYVKFYDEIINNIENSSITLSPGLSSIFCKETEIITESSPEDNTKKPLAEKYYFPLPFNEEQEKIIKKITKSRQIIVQGPPGTGKTHSIANLISHFLATGKRVLVTSQTDRALKVLKNKLPKEIQKLCIEVLGTNQDSSQDLKKSFESINSKLQNWNLEENTRTIKKLEEEDNKLKGQIAELKEKLHRIKNSESRPHKNLFRFYTGTPAVISKRLKKEEEKYKWIKENFNINTSIKCPVSNQEARSFLDSIKKIQDLEDSVLEEKIDFSTKIFTLTELEKKIQNENQEKQFIERCKNNIEPESLSYYSSLENSKLDQLKKIIISLILKLESLLNKDQEWIKKTLKDCLSESNKEWKHLLESTEKILKKNQENFLSAEKVTKIIIKTSKEINDSIITKLLEDFFKNYSPNDKINWRFKGFCSKSIRDLKKIKINNKNISSYKEVQKLDHYVKSKHAFRKIYNLWKNQGIDISRIKDLKSIMKNYHFVKNECEVLEECLTFPKSAKNINQVLPHYSLPKFDFLLSSLKKELTTVKFTQSKRTLKEIQNHFQCIINSLEIYKNQKNGIAHKIIDSYNIRDLKKYKNVLDKISRFKEKQKEFYKVSEIKRDLKNDDFYIKLRKDRDKTKWEKNLNSFEEAWAWEQADQWLKEQVSEDFVKESNQKKKDLIEKQRKNIELLVSEKAWNSCLSKITDKQLSSFKAWIHSIKKLGKGTGKSASSHRRNAKKRMEEFNTAIPAWIMPLYRVVENIKANIEPFDIAILDEASQTGPDGFLLKYIAKKVIVVGDKEQIIPEFIGIKDENVEIIQKKYLSDIHSDMHPELIGKDSYYDYCEIVSPRNHHVQLREHFRCMPEIINFSNRISYSGTPLIPLRQYGSSRLEPLKTTYVKEAVSKVGSSKEPQNEKEAKAIINQMRECLDDSKYKGKTFGIVVLQGKAQIQVIEKVLFNEIDKTEIEKRSIRVGSSYDFQGDERDIIFLSLSIANDWVHRPLTKENDKRRYNVAMSRAKDQVWLFHSIGLNYIANQDDFRYKLLSYFKSDSEKITGWTQDKLNELYRKIEETRDKSHENAPHPFDSWFEARVFHKIASRGYEVRPQHKILNYSIDMIIIGSEERLAVECDGDHWHSGEEKEQKDIERQDKLERHGWTFWRLRESQFNRNEEEAMKSLWILLNEMKIYPRT
ncbi:MAG: AAA family ATPase [Bdellovibrionales bacterium]|nr:AAA family ATPase [Bdellovibrionales bacterium]